MGDLPSVPLRLLTVRVPTRSKPATAWETPWPHEKRLRCADDTLVVGRSLKHAYGVPANRLKNMPLRG